jgi:hypothetical protein
MRALALLLAMTSAAPAAAFLCTRTEQGASIAWEQRQVVIRPTSDDGEEISALELADATAHGAAEWTGAPCSDMSVSVGAATSELRAGFDYRAGQGSPSNQNVVVFRKAAQGDPLDAWIHNDTNLAITTVTFLRSTAELLDADIEINDAGFVFSACEGPGCQDRHDIKNTLTHELGHVLGLDHPPSSQPGAADATMFATSSEGDLSKRDLAQDDVDGLCTLYPEGAATGECGDFAPSPPPAVRVTQVGGCAAAGTGAGLGAIAALLLGLGARGRRRGRDSYLGGGAP